MNNCKIQKIFFLFLTFPNILFLPGKAHTHLEEFPNNDNLKVRIIKGKDKLSISKVNIKNQLLSSLENIQNISTEDSQKTIKTLVNELFIESKVQSEKNNVLYADGEVIVKFKGNILQADRLIFNKNNKLAKAEGNILIKINKQIFYADEVEYDFDTNKGNFKNVKGLINSESIISDFDFNSNTIYKKFLPSIQRIQKDKVVFTPNKVTNWIFSAEFLKVDKNEWTSKEAFLTNDLLETNQIKLQFNELKIYPNKEKLRFKSKINYLIFQDRVGIPFWIGDRTIFKKSDNTFVLPNRWDIGYDKLNKDGFFIRRKFNSIKINKDVFFNLEPQFLLQRTLEGRTKSFSQRNYSLNSPKIKRNISLSDYFAINSSIEGKIKNWDLKITNELNSLDLDKFANALRTRAELSKEVNIFNDIFISRIFGAYREPIWNGSIGESEIYNAYGWQLDQTKSWKNNSVVKNQIITFAFGNYKAEELSNSDFVESYKGSITYQLQHSKPIYEKKIDSAFLNKSFEYIPEPIKQGFFINSKILGNYSLYKDSNSQKYFGVGFGPEIVMGNFKKDFFDYTRVSVLPFYKFNSGNSIFKFDQVSENFKVDLNFDQQIIGSLLIETQGTLNLDQNSDEYGEFIYSRIGINFKKRSYSFGIFYQPHDQAGGINFTLNGFK